MKRLTLAEASAMLIGTQIGTGVLGLPYALRGQDFGPCFTFSCYMHELYRHNPFGGG